MKQFLEKHKLPPLTQYETENLNDPVPIKNIEFTMLKLPKNKSPGPENFIGEFYKTLKELTSVLHNLFQKTGEEGTFPNSFYEASISITNQTYYKHIIKKKIRGGWFAQWTCMLKTKTAAERNQRRSK